MFSFCTYLPRENFFHLVIDQSYVRTNDHKANVFLCAVMTGVMTLTWTVHPLVVVRVDAHVLLLGSKGKLAALECFELVVGLQVRPAPHTAVDDMWQPFTMRHLQSSVQRAWDGHAAAGLAGAAERAFQLLHGAFLLL